MIFQSILQRLGKVKITIDKNIARNNVFVGYKIYFFYYPEILSIKILINSLDNLRETKENYFLVSFQIYEIKYRCVNPLFKIKTNTRSVSIKKRDQHFIIMILSPFLSLKMDSKLGRI